MRKSYDWLVVGGGFRSIIAAYGLARSGQSVALVEQGKTIGGFMSPIKWGDYWIDKGPQFFDNFEKRDLDFFNEMIGSDILDDIGFSYSSYLNGKKTDGFAIPDWRNYGDKFAKSVFDDRLGAQMGRNSEEVSQANSINSLADYIAYDGGEQLKTQLSGMCRKFLRSQPEDLSVSAATLVTFLGRKLLFDQETSLNLKKSPMIDEFLAAQKVQVGEVRYNLYPKGTSLETVRVALEQALLRVNVDILTETSIEDYGSDKKCATTTNGGLNYGKVFMGCDIRDSEASLLGTRDILDLTHILPEIFHCYVVPADSVDQAYYMVDYEENHLSARMTNFCNYMGCVDEDGLGVICVEQPIDRDSEEWENPEKDQHKIFNETVEAGNLSCDSFKTAKSFRIPSTYKAPKIGMEAAVSQFRDEIKTRFGADFVIPDALTLTRKSAMDDLRQLNIIE